MGYYINPPEGTKDEWLAKHGERTSAREVLKTFSWSGAKLPVCLVDNYSFKAAAIAFSKDEAIRFAYCDDGRPQEWWLVPRKALEPWYKESGA